ncbi:NUDIX hydrolase [Plantactinospora sonchi]|uniref:Nudix hydrolase domain-containing protein n=1 Tax=Plantactinospora sonchi TaxID=1544735 RepID=A0ABU7RM95_9ACTN
MQWILATAGAIVVGVLTNLVYDLVKYGTVRLPTALDRRSTPKALRGHDPVGQGLTPFVTWSKERQLSPASLRTTFVGRLDRPHLLAGDRWDRAVATLEAAGDRGDTGYVSHIEIDTGEHPAARDLRVHIARSRYAECLAAKDLATGEPDLASRLAAAMATGVAPFAEVVPPTMVSASVAVLSAEGRFLALRRSLAVRTFPGQWTVGINESMKYSAEPGAEEDFFGLVRRGLREELGLGPGDYGRIGLSWLGWSSPACCWVVVASVRARLSAAEIDARREQCHSVYEHDLARWLPLTRRRVDAIVRGDGPGPDGATGWAYLAPLVVGELWRFRDLV